MADGASRSSEPKRKCCTMGNLRKTSATYILVRPTFTLDHVATAVMSYRIGLCS